MSKSPPASSPWSFRIATVAGIPIRVHFTFLLLLVWIGALAYREESRAFALLLPAVFGCVVLHELGHALVAKLFGVQTRDITLYPIGGVAMLSSRPKPQEELWIALAGPAVNVVIAGITFVLVVASTPQPHLFVTRMDEQSFLPGLFAANLILAAFNMIPAFPMDGGRVLRAVLAMLMPEDKATRVAATIGQFLAILLGIWGVASANLLLVLIALFVYTGAGQEAQIATGLALVSGRTVRDAMMTSFRPIASGAPLSEAAELLLKGAQACFPVVLGEEVIGLLRREDIVRGLAEQGPSAYVAEFMSREFPKVEASQPLDRWLESVGAGDGALPALVFDDGLLVGILTPENLAEFLMLQQALRR